MTQSQEETNLKHGKAHGSTSLVTGNLMSVLRCIPMLSIMGILFFLSSVPGDAMALPDIINIDKYAHALAYAAFALSVLFALSRRFCSRHPYRTVIFVFCFCLLYGISDEFHQVFVPLRSPSVYDLMADGVGALLAMVLWLQGWLPILAGFLPCPWQNKSK